MNILKNFEALFVMTLGLACAANYALDNAGPGAAGAATATAATAPAAAAPAGMPVVVVSARRLTAQQKQLLLQAERKEAQGAARTI